MAKQPQITLPKGTKVPDHIAIIMDGNRRWARARGMDTLEGHKAGFDRAIELARAGRRFGVHTVSLWGFSTENWDREKRELDYLMLLYSRMIKRYLKEAMEEHVRLIHIGRKDRLPKSLISEIGEAERKTAHFDKHLLNICLDHGGRDDVIRAVNKYVVAKEAGKEIREMDEKVMLDYLDTSGQPYPFVDLLIRTSGEQRTSGFLMWQAAYAETYWESDHLPDFSVEKLRDAIIDYSRRRRRFGGNDSAEHLKFDPKLVAGLEIKWRHELALGEGERFSDLVIRYVSEHYGLSKDLAKQAGFNLISALKYRKREDWDEAKEALRGLYEIVKKSMGLALEPEIVANFEVKLWRDANEEDLRQMLAEKFRFSEFQARKSAHLAFLADAEMEKQNWDKAKGLLEKYYQALKERVA